MQGLNKPFCDTRLHFFNVRKTILSTSLSLSLSFLSPCFCTASVSFHQMTYAATAKKKKNNTGFSSPWHLKKRKPTIEETILYACTVVIVTSSLPLFFSLLNGQSK